MAFFVNEMHRLLRIAFPTAIGNANGVCHIIKTSILHGSAVACTCRIAIRRIKKEAMKIGGICAAVIGLRDACGYAGSDEDRRRVRGGVICSARDGVIPFRGSCISWGTFRNSPETFC